MASTKRTLTTVFVLLILLGLGAGGGALWLWQQKRSLQQDLDQAAQLLADGQASQADQLLNQRLLQAKAGDAWVPGAVALRLKALEAMGDAPAQQALANKVLGADHPWVQPGDEGWARAQLVLGEAALQARQVDVASAHFQALLDRPADTFGRDAATFGMAKIQIATPGKMADGKKLAEDLDSRLAEGDPLKPRVEAMLGDLNIRLLFSRQPYGNDQMITIARGDTIAGLGAKYHVSDDLLMRINGIQNARQLTVGRRIKVPDLALEITVNKTDNSLVVTNHGVFFKRYRVRTGEFDYMTPTGDYTIGRRVKEPAWTDPKTRQHYGPGDPGNQLGARWMGFASQPSIGIHEAVDVATVGTYGSNGCVGLAHDDILELYDLVPAGTPVHIVGERVETPAAVSTTASAVSSPASPGPPH